MTDSKKYTLLDAKEATGYDKIAFVQDFEYANISLNTSGNANFTVKFVISDAEDPPDPTSAQSVSNQYEYVEVIDLQNGSAIDGDTGVSSSGTDIHRHFQVNTSSARWLFAVITARSAGAITATARLFVH